MCSLWSCRRSRRRPRLRPASCRSIRASTGRGRTRSPEWNFLPRPRPAVFCRFVHQPAAWKFRFPLRLGSRRLAWPMRVPVSQPQADPVLDLSVLAALRELGGVDEPGLVDELLELFLQDSTRRLANLEDALARGDGLGLARTAHTLRSSSTNVGALRVARICMDLEACARDGEVRDAALRVRELARALAAVRAAHTQLRRAA
ncbi:MAG: hypothetical protein FJ294_08400 [Planctomycetes bacterium]|nr:hypothetical protein [Planctomycetota bacterium]